MKSDIYMLGSYSLLSSSLAGYNMRIERYTDRFCINYFKFRKYFLYVRVLMNDNWLIRPIALDLYAYEYFRVPDSDSKFASKMISYISGEFFEILPQSTRHPRKAQDI